MKLSPTYYPVPLADYEYGIHETVETTHTMRSVEVGFLSVLDNTTLGSRLII